MFKVPKVPGVKSLMKGFCGHLPSKSLVILCPPPLSTSKVTDTSLEQGTSSASDLNYLIKDLTRLVSTTQRLNGRGMDGEGYLTRKRDLKYQT